jgi:hypothetical protein
MASMTVDAESLWMRNPGSAREWILIHLIGTLATGALAAC